MENEDIDKLKLSNRLLINAEPVFKGELDEEIYFQYPFIGAVCVKAVYIDSAARMITRVGDRIYLAFPYSTGKATVAIAIHGPALFRRVRQYVEQNMQLSFYPTRNMTGSPSDGYVIVAGKKYNLKIHNAINDVIALVGDTYYFTYKRRLYRGEKSYINWRRKTTRKAFSEAISRVCELNNFKNPNMYFAVTRGGAFAVSPHNGLHLCVPEGAGALTESEMNCVALYYLLIIPFKNSLVQIKNKYPYLHEIVYYVIRKFGLEVSRDVVTQQIGHQFADNYIARHGEKVYDLIDKIVIGKGNLEDTKLHLCGSYYLQ